MGKRFWLACLAVFGILEVLNFGLHGQLLQADYEATKAVWRPDMMDKLWIFLLVNLIIAFFFTLVYTLGREGKGTGESLRYGFYVGIMLAVPVVYGTYAMVAIPYSMALKWFLASVVQMMLSALAVENILGQKT